MDNAKVEMRRTLLLLDKQRRERVKSSKSRVEGESSKGKRAMSKAKCFACHKFGHYVVQCPNKKKRQGEDKNSCLCTDG